MLNIVLVVLVSMLILAIGAVLYLSGIDEVKSTTIVRKFDLREGGFTYFGTCYQDGSIYYCATTETAPRITLKD
jgi:hypothetical protein